MELRAELSPEGSSLSRSSNNENQVAGPACTASSGGWQVQFWACPSFTHILSHHWTPVVCSTHTWVTCLEAWTVLYPLYTSRTPQHLALMSLSLGLTHHSFWHLGEETEAWDDGGRPWTPRSQTSQGPLPSIFLLPTLSSHSYEGEQKGVGRQTSPMALWLVMRYNGPQSLALPENLCTRKTSLNWRPWYLMNASRIPDSFCGRLP